uniref:Uncharacterized protein n=1 Tax=Octopus bimaculoides TaxID=37653 RepID=A0A0L8HRG5_OCTBM
MALNTSSETKIMFFVHSMYFFIVSILYFLFVSFFFLFECTTRSISLYHV